MLGFDLVVHPQFQIVICWWMASMKGWAGGLVDQKIREWKVGAHDTEYTTSQRECQWGIDEETWEPNHQAKNRVLGDSELSIAISNAATRPQGL